MASGMTPPPPHINDQLESSKNRVFNRESRFLTAIASNRKLKLTKNENREAELRVYHYFYEAEKQGNRESGVVLSFFKACPPQPIRRLVRKGVTNRITCCRATEQANGWGSSFSWSSLYERATDSSLSWAEDVS